MDMVRQVNYASCYSFIFSARPGTPAANMQNLVRPDVASERLARLQALLNEQQLEFNKKCEGLTMPILMERKGKKDGQLIGKSPYFQSVHVLANERLIGKVVDIKIKNGYDKSLSGDIMTTEQISTAANT